MSGIIFLPIFMTLFDYYAMGIAKPNDVEFFNDLERFLCSCFLLVRVLLIRRRRPALRGLPDLPEVSIRTFVGLASDKRSYYDDFRWNFVTLRGRSWSFLLC